MGNSPSNQQKHLPHTKQPPAPVSFLSPLCTPKGWEHPLKPLHNYFLNLDRAFYFLLALFFKRTSSSCHCKKIFSTKLTLEWKTLAWMIQILQSSVQPNNISRYFLLKKLKLALPATVNKWTECMCICLHIWMKNENTYIKNLIYDWIWKDGPQWKEL